MTFFCTNLFMEMSNKRMIIIDSTTQGFIGFNLLSNASKGLICGETVGNTRRHGTRNTRGRSNRRRCYGKGDCWRRRTEASQQGRR